MFAPKLNKRWTMEITEITLLIVIGFGVWGIYWSIHKGMNEIIKGIEAVNNRLANPEKKWNLISHIFKLNTKVELPTNQLLISTEYCSD